MLKNQKVRRTLIVVGLLVLVFFAGLSWHFGKSIDSAAPDSPEEKTFVKYYFISKILSAVGFLIAIIPSTLELKYEVEKLTTKKTENEENENNEDNEGNEDIKQSDEKSEKEENINNHPTN